MWAIFKIKIKNSGLKRLKHIEIEPIMNDFVGKTLITTSYFHNYLKKNYHQKKKKVAKLKSKLKLNHYNIIIQNK